MPGLGTGWSEKLVCLPSWGLPELMKDVCDGVVRLLGTQEPAHGSSCLGYHQLWVSG